MVQIGDVLPLVCLPNCVLGYHVVRGHDMAVCQGRGSEKVKWPGRSCCLKKEDMIEAWCNFPGLDVIHYH